MPTLRSPSAPARYCPACGGPDADATGGACRFCGAPRLPLGVPDPRVSILCSACGTANAGGASFCMACGGGLAHVDAETAARPPCPGCAEPQMHAVALAPTPARPQGHRVLSCPRCGAVWLPLSTREAMIASAQRDAEAPGGPVPGRGPRVVRRELPAGVLAAKVVYRRCPECTQTMMRRNFGGCSGVIVDECRCGSFFDAGELAAVLEFVRSGGLALAKEREEIERAREIRRAATPPVSWTDPEGQADLSRAFLRWAARIVGALVG